MPTRGRVKQKIGFHLILTLLIIQILWTTSMFSDNSKIAIRTVVAQPDIQSIINQIPREEAKANMEEWTTPNYQMLLISQPEWHDESQIFADWKNKVGIRTLVVSNWSLFNGTDGAEKVRNSIKWYYNLYPVQWVLLMGGTSVIPIREIYNPDLAEVNKTSETSGLSTTLKPTDFYYAELTADWNIDGDNLWGESGKYNNDNGLDEWEYETEVYVGRFPANTANELKAMINKTIDYEQGVGAGLWMNRYMAASGISDPIDENDLNGEDEAFLNQYIIDNIIGTKMDWGHWYEATANYDKPFISGHSAYLGSDSIKNAINTGFSVGIWAGHGDPTYFQSRTCGSAFYATDVNSLTNQNMYPLLYADACSTARIDRSGSVGEAFIKAENAGGIGYIGCTRLSWYWPNDTDFEILNRGLARAFMEEMFLYGKSQQGKALYDSKALYRSYPWFSSLTSNYRFPEIERKVLMMYILLGDPSVHIYTNVTQSFSELFNDSKDYFEGMTISKVITTTEGKPVSNAMITIWNEEGYYRSFSSDTLGRINITLPVGTTKLSYSLSAHNMNYTTGEFELGLDLGKPIFTGAVRRTPSTITIADKPIIEIDVTDNQSGVMDAYVILTTNDYNKNRIFPMHSNPTVNNENFSVELPQLEFNSYEFMIVAFDHSSNYEIYIDESEKQTFTIPVPAQIYLLIGMNGILIGAVIITFSRLTRKVFKVLDQEKTLFEKNNSNT